MDNRSSAARAQWEASSQEGSFGSMGSPGSASTESSSTEWSVGREAQRGDTVPDYMNTPRFTCKSPLDSVVNAAHKAFNGCFKKKKQRAVKAAITSIQGQCARNVEAQSSKRGYLRRQETLCHCIEESLNSRDKTPERVKERKPSSKRITVEIKEHFDGGRASRHRGKDPKYAPLSFARKSMQPSVGSQCTEAVIAKGGVGGGEGGGGKLPAHSTAGRFRKKKTRSLSEDLGKAPRFEHTWTRSRAGAAA